MTYRARAFWIASPGVGEIRPVTLRAPGPDEVLVRSVCSGISKGTETLAHAIAQSKAFSIAGGGDTLAAVDKYGIAGDVSYISTGGGAFLEFLEGKTLPAVAALEARGA